MDGTCKKDSTHTWKVGDEIFMQKKDDGTWLICKDDACFKSQGGTVEESKPKGAGRTLDMSMAFAKAFDNMATPICNDRIKELFKDLDSPAAQKDRDVVFKKAEIFAKIYQTLATAFNGK